MPLRRAGLTASAGLSCYVMQVNSSKLILRTKLQNLRAGKCKSFTVFETCD